MVRRSRAHDAPQVRGRIPWRLGFLDALTLRTGERAFVKKVLASAPARFLRRPHHRSPATRVRPRWSCRRRPPSRSLPGGARGHSGRPDARPLFRPPRGRVSEARDAHALARIGRRARLSVLRDGEARGLHRGTGLAHHPEPEGAGATPGRSTSRARHGRGSCRSPSAFSISNVSACDNAIDALHGDTLTKRLEDVSTSASKTTSSAAARASCSTGRHASRARGPELELELELELVAAELSVPEAVPFLLYRLTVATPPESDWVRAALEAHRPSSWL